MKILVVSAKALLPIESGMELRVYNLLRPLCSKHEISLLCFAPEEDKAEEPIEDLRTLFHKVELVPKEKTEIQKIGLLRRLGRWLWPPADFFGEGTSINMQNAIEFFLKTDRIDLIHIAGLRMIGYFLETTHVPIIFSSIDDLSLYLFRSIKEGGNLLEKARFLKDWLAGRNFEKRYYCKFKEIVVSSPVDGKIINSFCPHSNVTVISNGVDSHYFRPVSLEPEKSILVFSGVMDYEPNVLAMTFFCKSIFPLIKREIPDSQLLIVGRNPTPEIVSLEKEMSGVEVTGSVDDVRPYLAQAKVYVCPLRSGSGIKNKVLEAWAAGKPIVATSLSCEGIEVSPGEDVLIADDAQGFAGEVVKLLQDEGLRRKLAQKGRKKVEEKYDWESKAEMLEKAYLKVMENSSIDVGN